MDDAVDRRRERYDREFSTMVEATRAGWLTAHSTQNYQRWQRRKKAPVGRALNDAALEQAILGLAQMFPGQVTRVTA